MQRLFSATGPPSQAWWPQRTRTAKRSGRLATASSACQTKTGWQNCKARQDGSTGKDRSVRRLYGAVQPAARRSVLGKARQQSCLDRPSCAPCGSCQAA